MNIIASALHAQASVLMNLKRGGGKLDKLIRQLKNQTENNIDPAITSEIHYLVLIYEKFLYTCLNQSAGCSSSSSSANSSLHHLNPTSSSSCNNSAYTSPLHQA